MVQPTRSAAELISTTNTRCQSTALAKLALESKFLAAFDRSPIRSLL
jgi:hypothetical protein